MSILFQNIPQLQNRYPDNQWEEILGGCDFSIFLGCNDMTTATYYSDRTGEVTVSVASVRKNFYTIRATDYVPEYSESRSLGKRQLLLPDEVLRYPLNQGILIIRGHNVLRFRKMDYTEHADAKQLRMEKVVEHIPKWFPKWEEMQKQENLFQGQELESNLEPNRDDSAITKSAEEIERLIRGLNPWPSAFTYLDEKVLKIWDADVIDEEVAEEPGTIISTNKTLKVATADGYLDIKELQLQGKKRMDVVSFLNGYKINSTKLG